MYPLFSKTKRSFADKMKDFWVKSAYQCFRVMSNPNDYDREALKDILVKIKPYSQDVERGISYSLQSTLQCWCNCYHVQTQLPTTQVRGGTFIVNGKPCIVLTDLNKKVHHYLVNTHPRITSRTIRFKNNREHYVSFNRRP
jgi:HTH-type transcriptional regulator/antitoxin HigA